MAFPVDAARAGFGTGTATTLYNANVPDCVAGDLLVILVRSPSGAAISWPDASYEELAEDASDSSDDSTAIVVKWCTEPVTTVDIGFDSSSKVGGVGWRITGGDPLQTPELSAVQVGASTTPDPLTCTPTGGAKDYLWLWLGACEGEQTNPPAGNPTNYSNPVGGSSGSGGAVASNCRCFGASRQNNAASEDGGSWTISVSDSWTAWVMAIHPYDPQKVLNRLGLVHHNPPGQNRDPWGVIR